jgi:hypothetical protein
LVLFFGHMKGNLYVPFYLIDEFLDPSLLM